MVWERPLRRQNRSATLSLLLAKDLYFLVLKKKKKRPWLKRRAVMTQVPPHHRGWLQNSRQSRRESQNAAFSPLRRGEVTDAFIETKLTKMWKFMREFGVLAFGA